MRLPGLRPAVAWVRHGLSTLRFTLSEPGIFLWGEVRVAVHATSVNPLDWKVREGHRRMLAHQLPIIPGWWRRRRVREPMRSHALLHRAGAFVAG